MDVPIKNALRFLLIFITTAMPSVVLLNGCTSTDPEHITTHGKQLEKASEELLFLLGSPKVFEQTQKQLKYKLRQKAIKDDLSQQERLILSKYNRRLLKMTRQDFNWERLKNPLIDIFVENYTYAELEQILSALEKDEREQFQQTPLGKRFVKTTSDVSRAAMLISTHQLNQFKPKFNKLVEEMMFELEDV